MLNKKYTAYYLITTMLLVLAVSIVTVGAASPQIEETEVATTDVAVPVILDGVKYTAEEFNATYGPETILHYLVTDENPDTLYAFKTEKDLENYLKSQGHEVDFSEDTMIETTPLQTPSFGSDFSLFIDNPWIGGWAFYLDRGYSSCNLGSYDNDISVVVPTDYSAYTRLYDYSGCWWSTLTIYTSGGPWLVQLANYGWNQRASGIYVAY